MANHWNPLEVESDKQWEPVPGLEGHAEQLTLSVDEATGERTHLTRFLPGADTVESGASRQDYQEEIFVVSGRLFDAASDTWLETGHYASRPPGEVHGPYRTDEGCVVLAVSFPDRNVS